MKTLIIFCLNFTFIFHSFARETQYKSYWPAFEDFAYSASQVDPVSILNGNKKNIKRFITEIFNSYSDQEKLSQVISNFDSNKVKAEYSKNKKSIIVVYAKTKFIFSDFDVKQKSFKLNGKPVSLKKVYSFSDLQKSLKKLEPTILTTQLISPIEIIFPSAHAALPLAGAIIIYAVIAAGLYAAGMSQNSRLSLDDYEDDLKSAEAVCEAKKDIFGQYTQRYETTISNFEETSKRLYNMTSSKARREARSVKNCEELRRGFRAYVDSWIYSIVNLTWEDWRDKVVDLCKRATRVQGCIERFQAELKRVDDSNRNLFPERQTGRNSRRQGSSASGN